MERLIMKKQYTMAALQMGYLQAELENQVEVVGGETCLLCWKSSCGCDAPSVKDDPFLNMPNENEVLMVNEVQIA
jgi:hypothetical protein